MRTPAVTALLCLAGLLGVLGSWTSAANAQACEPEPTVNDGTRAVARTHYAQGVEASQGGQWSRARESFQRAYEVAAFSPIVYNLATAQAQTGMIVEAAENYRRFLRRCQSEQTPELRADAQQLLDTVTPRIGHLTLRIDNLAAVDTIDIDGNELSSAILGTSIPVNPGRHTVHVVRNGEGEVGSEEFRVSEGGESNVSMTVPVYVPPVDPVDGAGGGDASGGGLDGGAIAGIVIAVVLAVAAAVTIPLVIVLTDTGTQQAPVAGTWQAAQVPLLSW